jgi:hypothetical protein
LISESGERRRRNKEKKIRRENTTEAGQERALPLYILSKSAKGREMLPVNVQFFGAQLVLS